MLAGIGGVLPQVAEAYRSGGGVPYEKYGAEFRHGQGHIYLPAFTNESPSEWLQAMPDIAERLRAERPARVADVGCGQGWSTIAVARAFPNAEVVGLDADAGSIADARRHAAEAGVDVRFAEGDASALESGPYDLVMILETLHDLPRPVDALRAARAAAAPGGAVLVVDERVADSFTAPGDEVERMMYGWSVTHCLPRSWSTSRRPRWAPSYAPTPCASARPRPATRASTCCRWRTTSSGCTGSIPDATRIAAADRRRARR